MRNSLLYRSLQAGALRDPPDVEAESPTTPPSPNSINDDPARERRGPTIRTIVEAKGP